MAPRRLSDRDKDQIVQLYQQKGMTLAMLAEQFGVSASTVGRVVRQGPPTVGAVQEDLLASGPVAEVPKPSGKGRPVRKVKGGDLEPAIAPPLSPSADSNSGPSPSPSSGVKLPGAEGRSSDDGAAKRTRRRSRSRSDGDGGTNEPAPAIAAPEEDAPALDSPRTKPQRRSRSRSPEAATEALPLEPTPEESSSPAPKASPKTIIKASSKTAPAVSTPAPASGRRDRRSQAMVDEIEDPYGDELEDETDLDLLEDGDDFDDDDEDDDDGDIGQGLGIITRANATEPIEIYPLTAASIPNPCYLVVDRAANLVVRPLKDFQELGAIPDGEANCNTLPVFDNHRVARRFSGRTQRVIKVPDSSIFAKATPHLQEKDITRLLIDGQVYAL